MRAIIVYEVYNREYDNCLLLKEVLEQKCNYNVEIVYKMNLLSLKRSDEKTIVFIPNCYNDDNFKYYYYACGQKNAILVNMQYEQILSDNKNNIDIHLPKGRASKLYNVCWGKSFYEFLNENGINKELLFIGGALQLDFMRKEFTSYWKSREEIAKEFDLPTNKTWVLFMSSFAYANNALVFKASDKDYGKDNNIEFRQLSGESREEILKWFKKVLDEDDSRVIIYRKHPMEKYDEKMQEIAKQYSNRLYFIDKYNVKQWIFTSDIILNWYSTSAAECVTAKKTFGIIRPIKIKDELEVVLFKGAHFVESYEDFLKYLQSQHKEGEYCFDIKKLERIYEINEQPSYDKILQNIKRIENEDLYLDYVDPDYDESRKKFIHLKKLRNKVQEHLPVSHL